MVVQYLRAKRVQHRIKGQQRHIFIDCGNLFRRAVPLQMLDAAPGEVHQDALLYICWRMVDGDTRRILCCVGPGAGGVIVQRYPMVYGKECHFHHILVNALIRMKPVPVDLIAVLAAGVFRLRPVAKRAQKLRRLRDPRVQIVRSFRRGFGMPFKNEGPVGVRYSVIIGVCYVDPCIRELPRPRLHGSGL